MFSATNLCPAKGLHLLQASPTAAPDRARVGGVLLDQPETFRDTAQCRDIGSGRLGSA